MKNKYIILIFLIVSVLFNLISVSYYFFKIKPTIKILNDKIESQLDIKQKEDEFFNKTLACKALGDRFIEEEQRVPQDNFGVLSHLTVYSPIYNACIILYKNWLRYTNETVYFNQILNLNTMKDIYYFTYIHQRIKPYTKTIEKGNEEEYKRIVNEIFDVVE